MKVVVLLIYLSALAGITRLASTEIDRWTPYVVRPASGVEVVLLCAPVLAIDVGLALPVLWLLWRIRGTQT